MQEKSCSSWVLGQIRAPVRKWHIWEGLAIKRNELYLRKNKNRKSSYGKGLRREQIESGICCISGNMLVRGATLKDFSVSGNRLFKMFNIGCIVQQFDL